MAAYMALTDTVDGAIDRGRGSGDDIDEVMGARREIEIDGAPGGDAKARKGVERVAAAYRAGTDVRDHSMYRKRGGRTPVRGDHIGRQTGRVGTPATHGAEHDGQHGPQTP